MNDNQITDKIIDDVAASIYEYLKDWHNAENHPQGYVPGYVCIDIANIL